MGLVLVVGGLALVDSVRGCETSGTEATPPPPTAETTPPTTTSTDGPAPQEEAPEGWPQGDIPGVLSFVDADSCRIRSIGLAGGRERPLTEYQTNCGGFWGPRVSARLAYEVDDVARRRFLIQISDTGQGPRDYGHYTSTTPLVWELDGQRVAWCDRRQGVEREVLGKARRLPFCPLAYTPQGNLVHAEGRRLVLGTTTLARAPAPIVWARFGTNGSFVVLAKRLLRRYENGQPAGFFTLPNDWSGEPPVASPDTCSVAVPAESGIDLIDLCSGRGRTALSGHAAAWSPDGEWLAIADSQMIVFRRADHGGETIIWPARAFALAWSTS